jgi:hypothetical protein
VSEDCPQSNNGLTHYMHHSTVRAMQRQSDRRITHKASCAKKHRMQLKQQAIEDSIMRIAFKVGRAELRDAKYKAVREAKRAKYA